ncbi:deoxyribonuclease V [Kribbella sp. CA-293567]|uniref:deoxyribonuclease V n=1 Tax=Kribbella sp. CA-293567 TaxID=3002436 RepID=UPI0022DE3AB1|nr:deoxyribonuclease V [Kribbella sp. CA-293567]WBQ02700.1 deoxyribonuclease V [Kribbella sp. CA-293567]
MHWPTTATEAIAVQDQLRAQVDANGPGPSPAETRYVAGLDVAYDGDDLAAAIVVLDSSSLEEVDRAIVIGRTAFPYVPGLFAFREVPALLDALGKLSITPDLLVCDGQGLAHPRRFGLACHLGVLTSLPTIGIAKNAFVGTYSPPAAERGAYSDLLLDDELVGAVVRTQPNVKPVFVSIGHRVDLATAIAHTLHLTPQYRLPETTRAADHACRAAHQEFLDD